MNKILFNFILGIAVTVNMLFFPVQAEGAHITDAQTVVEDLQNEESSDGPAEDTDIGNDSETASDGNTIDEAVFAEETEEEAGNGDTAEEGLTEEGAAEEAADGERNEAEEGQQEDPSAGVTENIPDDPEDSSAGMTEMRPDDPEDPSAGMTEMLPDDPEELPEQQIPDDDPGEDEKPEEAGTAVPARVYARPVINSIVSDGKSITLQWDNAEGAQFQVYRWNIIPSLIGTTTAGSFVDTDVVYGRTYTYFISTNSSAYRYPYSQTVSKWVRRPIEEIDKDHRIGEDLAWNIGEGGKERHSLVISGNGSMPDFTSPSEIPWHDSAGEIRHISIDDGVTYVGDYSFSELEGLQEVSLPSSVREYGREVFRGSTNLEYFNHDSAVDGDQLHIAVQYLMGVYSGDTFEPEVNVRKGPDEGNYDGMPALVRGRDYTIAYKNTTEVGDGTIEITFIGDYADAGSVVIPFTVVSELKKGEKIKNVTGIELQPSRSTYTGSAQHPDMIVRSGHWILKEGTDYILTYKDMVDAGTYTVTAQGIGAYSGKVQAVYTILEQKQSEDPKPPVKPSVPDEDPKPGPDKDPSRETETKPDHSNEEKTDPTDPKEGKTEEGKTEEGKTEREGSGADAEPGNGEGSETAAEPENEEVSETAAEPEKEVVTVALAEPDKEEAAESVTKPKKNSDNSSAGSDNHLENDMFGKGDFSPGSSMGRKGSEHVEFFVGAVGILASICIGVYFWFFHWFVHGM